MVSFSAGQPVAAGAPGGHLSVNGGAAAAAVILVGAIVGELLQYVGGADRPGPKPMAPDTRISHTCSCYGYKPPAAALQGAAGDK